MRVRLEQARTFFQIEDDGNAKRNFELVLSGNLPPAVAANVQRFLDEIRRRKATRYSFGIALVPSTNVNQAPSVRTVTLFGLPFRLDDAAQRKTGIGAVTRGSAERFVVSLKTWLETQLHRLPPRGGLAGAIRYALARWPALCRFLDDGRVDLDNNAVERAIRPVALGRKNHLFAGSDGGADRWAIVASILATAKHDGIEPYAYLERMTLGHPANRIDELLPWNWNASNVET